MNDIEKYEARKEHIKEMRKKVKCNETYIKIRKILRDVMGSNPTFVNMYSMSVSCKYFMYEHQFKDINGETCDYRESKPLLIEKLKEAFLKYNIQGIKIDPNESQHYDPIIIINIPFESIFEDQY